MNGWIVILLVMILATLLFGANRMLSILGVLFFGAFAAVVGLVLMAVTDGAVKDWFQTTIAIVFLCLWGLGISVMIWEGLKWIWIRLKWIWTRLTGKVPQGSAGADRSSDCV